MEVNVVDGEGDIVLKTHLRFICGCQSKLWIPTNTKTTPAKPIIWLAGSASGEDSSESANIVSKLAYVQYDRQRTETGEHEPFRGFHTVQFKKVLWLLMIHEKPSSRRLRLSHTVRLYGRRDRASQI